MAWIGAASAGRGASVSVSRAAKRTFFNMSVCFRLICCRSCDAQDGHQTGRLMVHDVTMQHPVAGIVGDESALHDIFWPHEDRVGPLAERNGRAIAAEQAQA